MGFPRTIDTALDLARMPSIARSAPAVPIPADILDVIRIAAGCPETCRAAELVTGQPSAVLIAAARFYLQHVLFRPDAEPHRILGLNNGASREQARCHMRWLLQWLHPDRNGTWDSVYAERVVRAWKDVSSPQSGSPVTGHQDTGHGRPSRRARRTRRSRVTASIRLPWIAHYREQDRSVALGRFGRVSAAALALLLLLGLLALPAFNPGARLASLDDGALRASHPSEPETTETTGSGLEASK